MEHWTSRRDLLRGASAGLAAGLAGCGGNGTPEEQARSHRDALSKYTDVAAAIEDGYLMATPYVRSDEGVLGLPFFKIPLRTGELVPEEPQILFYDLHDDGTYELLGVEWLVSTESADSPPSLFGRELHEEESYDSTFLPDHYGLHAWLFEDNPDGLFSHYHTGAEPPSYIADLETAWEALDPYYTNPEKLVADRGYTDRAVCASSEDGGYGIPYTNTDEVGTDLTAPPVMLYRTSASWSFQLLGAEWYVPADSVDAPPSMFGQPFHEPMDGHSDEYEQGRHYGLHAWLFTANPNGMFARYNPLVNC